MVREDRESADAARGIRGAVWTTRVVVTVGGMSAVSLAARALAAVALAVVMLVPSAAPAATPAEVRYGVKTHQQVNKVRVNHDLRALKKQKCLQRFAVKQAKRMANRQRIFHQDLGKVMRACGLNFAGENVAAGTVPPKRIVKGWMNSPPHRENILRTQFRLTGVAAKKAHGAWWVVQVFGRKA